MKNSKNGIATLLVVINLQDELVHLKKIYWILYQQCGRLVIILSILEVFHQKMACQSKDMLHQKVVPNGPLTTLPFMLNK